MKVYELMQQLADMPSGYEVAFVRLADKTEIPKILKNSDLCELDFTIREAATDDDHRRVILDGWAE